MEDNLLPAGLRRRIKAYQDDTEKLQAESDQRRAERRAIALKLREAGVSMDRIASLIGVSHRTYVTRILKGEA
jgi:transcriptional regulator with PAS, ATPase and Fis domain